MRENQRKSRARRQEHVRELEQRLAACKDESQQKDIEYRLALQKVEAENQSLKSLLGSLGVSRDLIHQYVSAASQSTVVNRKVAIPSIQRAPEAVPATQCNARTSPAVEPIAGHPTVKQTCGPLSTPQSRSVESTSSSTHNLPPESPIFNPEGLSVPSLCCSQPGNEQSLSSGDDVLNTTLCAIAEDLISQYNVRGVDMDKIRERLWSGFRSGTPGDGCRIQNNILFQVLDEISHGV